MAGFSQSQKSSLQRVQQSFCIFLVRVPHARELALEVKAFWVGASRQFASTWAARSQNVTVAIGYHMQEGRSYKTLFDTVFYRSELKAAAQAFRDRLQVKIIFTNPDMTEADMEGAASVIYERARLLSPVHAEKFQESTTWRWGGCAKESLAFCQTPYLLNKDAFFYSNLGYLSS